jgi:hypothetical protein
VLRALLFSFSLPLYVSMSAQSVRVYSEFARINPAGEVTAPAQPREILSPAIVRNGFTSFQIVVQVEPETPYSLYIGQNPEDAVRVTVYRESGEKLEPVDLPFEAKSTQVLWMDVWVDRNAPVRRVKVEPQLNVKQDWIVYPMEARVMDALVPDEKPALALCGGAIVKSGNTLATARLRNAGQDASLAVRLPKQELEKLKAQCATPPSDPESYLKIRDYLSRMR